jgi:hypothetical protein
LSCTPSSIENQESDMPLFRDAHQWADTARVGA